MNQPSSQKKASSAVSQPKQIKFVSNDGLPQTKRRRVTAACRTCRKRKIKCSGERPVCHTCTDCGHTCLGYNDPPNARPLLDGEEAEEQIVKESKSPEVEHRRGSSNAGDEQARLSKQQHAAQSREGQAQTAARATTSVGVESPESARSALISSHRTHVPYFRYFGPTAIVPGFKQMVVRVRESKKGNSSMSTGSEPHDVILPKGSINLTASPVDSSSSVRSPNAQNQGSVLQAVGDAQPSHSIHFYEPEDNLPNSDLVTHLCETFFTHIGCCFPFLKRDRFLRELAEKQLEPILVDAVCAVAARYSLHPLLKAETEDKSNFPSHGDPFAHRAMCAVVDALACPTLDVVQACLLLAWGEFGSNRDSGLWMYLGISIRMAQDLGMQKLEGMKYRYGRVGLTPKEVLSGQASDFDESQLLDDSDSLQPGNKSDVEDERARERARVDTFWSIFFLDRVISSGTGRPVTLRDDDIEIFFPLQAESNLPNGWPAPFPHLIRIIHLYGRITDMLNSVREVNHVTSEKLRVLAGMESDLTNIYQRLSPKLHFNAVNFQNYVTAGEGPNFLLLHFWFHTLIVLLHQPTLLHSFGGRIQQLFPNSRELSMSSAKTIADILTFAELIDTKSFISIPFSSQPIYIAGCAFLMESVFYSQPSSRSESPPLKSTSEVQSSEFMLPSMEANVAQRKPSAKHSLLAAAAKENYQRCYKALKSLETYWAGIKYILTVLDQKAKGIWDPQLYTAEEMDSTIEETPVIESTTLASAGLKPTEAKKAESEQAQQDEQHKKPEYPRQASANAPSASASRTKPIDPTQAIGWSLTGDTESAQPNLSFLYQLPISQQNSGSYPSSAVKPDSRHGETYQSLPMNTQVIQPPVSGYVQSPVQYQSPSSFSLPVHGGQTAMQATPGYHPLASADGSPSSSYNLGSAPTMSSPHAASPQASLPHMNNNLSTSNPYSPQSAVPGAHSLPDTRYLTSNPLQYATPENNVSGMTIQSQDIDMNTLHDQNGMSLPFDQGFIPWLEYLPQDVLNYFGEHQGYRPAMRPEDPESTGPTIPR